MRRRSVLTVCSAAAGLGLALATACSQPAPAGSPTPLVAAATPAAAPATTPGAPVPATPVATAAPTQPAAPGATPTVPLAATAVPATAPPSPRVTMVVVGAFTYDPRQPTIRVGEAIEWVGEDGVGHTVTSRTGLFNADLGRGDRYQFTFTSAGEFEYFCEYHRSMRASIIVVP